MGQIKAFHVALFLHSEREREREREGGEEEEEEEGRGGGGRGRGMLQMSTIGKSEEDKYVLLSIRWAKNTS